MKLANRRPHRLIAVLSRFLEGQKQKQQQQHLTTDSVINFRSKCLAGMRAFR
jgi:hypothetical protein